ncbi:MAG: prephenate dehydrogenase [Faecalibacterium sp.]|nr:prephenate dehydrogenase [Ruminococcus sp.]MCM1392765.1 prephenate dehydrogenase [Ruminococcus sp.]MCM1485329.1 prephenate dehydrogenase [Faecalibacterium sp.]
MMINKNTKFLIVGLGLLGGSYARGLTEKGYYVEAITRTQSTIDYAIEHEMIQKGTIEPNEEMIANADIIVFSLYPHVFVEWIEQYGKYIKSGTIITDVTGVKKCIVEKIQNMLPDDVEFISAHPMAGKEVYGIENSDEKIFFGANYVVVPTEKNTEDGIEACKRIGEILGFGRITQLSPEEHDEMIGFVSQLTHCIAVALMTCYEHEHLEKYTGDSFRDLTRIANINEVMWSELFLLNKESLLRQMDLFKKEFEKLEGYLIEDNREGMMEMMKNSTARRKLFDK